MTYTVIKLNDLMLLTNPSGNIKSSEQGLYTSDTRFLSTWDLLLDSEEPQLLGRRTDSAYQEVLLTNPTVHYGDKRLPHGALLIKREQMVYDAMYERITIENFHVEPVSMKLDLQFSADFADIFEVRGAKRPKRGTTKILPEQSSVSLTYKGLDELERNTRISFNPVPDNIAETATFLIDLKPKESTVIYIRIHTRDTTEDLTWDEAFARQQQHKKQWFSGLPEIKTSNQALNKVLEQSFNDLYLLTNNLGEGDFPVAGTPWFAVPFGRDSILTALQMLPFKPELAKGTLKTLAKYQGQATNKYTEEQPGKILHEMRQGEMSNLGEVPFGRYYGTVDATPLFLILLAEYYHWTKDKELFLELLPAVNLSLEWMKEYGDLDGDGFLEYDKADSGLVNQYWKDSDDSTSHSSGELAQAPIAIVEVQGYAYLAKTSLAKAALDLGLIDLAKTLNKEAEELKQKFEEHFWLEDKKFYALGLDANKKPLAVINSDTGQCLWTGIISTEKAKPVTEKLMSPELNSGWGIRTLGTKEQRYSPMSYHNGSVWPHDNSFIFLGLIKYGYHQEASELGKSLLDAAIAFDNRLPELYAGFQRENSPPVGYPVACSPQAWSAGTIPTLIQGFMGIQEGTPFVPDWLEWITIKGITIKGQKYNLKILKDKVETTPV